MNDIKKHHDKINSNNNELINYDLQIPVGMKLPKDFKLKEKKDDEMYCINCGKIINKNTVFCPSCGVQLKEVKVELSNTLVTRGVAVKSKAVAVVLAVFFSFWSWLYTYGKNGKKFWTSLIGLGTIVGLSIASTINIELSWLRWIIILWPIAVCGIWLYAIIDNAVRDYKFYIDYPND